ncbi:MAG TPA: SRPBCC family protein [Limnobacter sp.]|uniref:SRPBCC family protein n=1 Tax=Limnobacter sp. TaxID=2003368 RepID=UPI002ED88773
MKLPLPWFSLRPVTDESFFDTAPIRFTYVMNLAASADEVWAGLVADRPLSWCKALTVQYTSPRPFGVGTRREVGAQFNLVRMKERFFIWDDEARRHAFYVEKANVPLLSQFAEDYQVTPTEQGCQFVWRFAMAGRPGLATALQLTQALPKRLVFDGLVNDTQRHFKTV